MKNEAVRDKPSHFMWFSEPSKQHRRSPEKLWFRWLAAMGSAAPPVRPEEFLEPGIQRFSCFERRKLGTNVHLEPVERASLR